MKRFKLNIEDKEIYSKDEVQAIVNHVVDHMIVEEMIRKEAEFKNFQRRVVSVVNHMEMGEKK